MKQDILVLHLNVYKTYFMQILSGRKVFEFREDTPYWRKRLLNRRYDVVCIKNGYAKNAPTLKAQFIKVHHRKLKGKSFFAIELGHIHMALNLTSDMFAPAVSGKIRRDLRSIRPNVMILDDINLPNDHAENNP